MCFTWQVMPNDSCHYKLWLCIYLWTLIILVKEFKLVYLLLKICQSVKSVFLTCLTWFFSYSTSIYLKCDITITMPLSISPVVRNEVKNLPLEWREWRRHQFLVVFGEPLVWEFLQCLVQRLPRTRKKADFKIVHITSSTCISKREIKIMSLGWMVEDILKLY